MRATLEQLFSNTIVFTYDLPHNTIQKVAISTEPDECYKVNTLDMDLAKIIHNGIVEYSFDAGAPELSDLNSAQLIALQTCLRFNRNAVADVRLKYGFYGEVLLYLFLQHFHRADTLISRGHFYLPTEKSETKGYDTYQMYQAANGVLELWFGEVKFHQSYIQAVNSIFNSLGKALSDDYLNDNFLDIYKERSSLDQKGKFNAILSEWFQNPTINIFEYAKRHNVMLVYPMLTIFDDKNKSYDEVIKMVVDYINKNHSTIINNLTIPSRLFFMFLPVSSTKDIKNQVLQWIDSNAPQI